MAATVLYSMSRTENMVIGSLMNQKPSHASEENLGSLPSIRPMFTLPEGISLVLLRDLPSFDGGRQLDIVDEEELQNPISLAGTSLDGRSGALSETPT